MQSWTSIVSPVGADGIYWGAQVDLARLRWNDLPLLNTLWPFHVAFDTVYRYRILYLSFELLLEPSKELMK